MYGAEARVSARCADVAPSRWDPRRVVIAAAAPRTPCHNKQADQIQRHNIGQAPLGVFEAMQGVRRHQSSSREGASERTVTDGREKDNCE